MKILLVNDDGFDSIGIKAVADSFKREHEVTIVAPDSQMSAFSHSVTLKPNTILWRKVESDIDTYAVKGTPVDCLKLGLFNFAPNPDLVIAGINMGQNLGTDILYSGTVSIASDAACLGYRAIALSVFRKDSPVEAYYDCAEFLKNNLGLLMSYKLPKGAFININFPDCKPRGVRVAKMSSIPTFIDAYDDNNGEMNINGHRNFDMLENDTDERLCRDGYITVTPLTVDMTDYNALKTLKKEKFVL
ncbi:MAG: 5'/3'-nucleotidase SurE [Clostridiales bacterium]|nr:5'/3'-nucleotidase SurE [Clostridiales bacterium]